MKQTTITTQKFIQLTPEYLYEKGKKSYQEALLEEEISKQQEKYIDTMLYFQGAMFLGSNDACVHIYQNFIKMEITLELIMNN
ncbi:hypothetical protein RAS_05550 [Rickettsia asiatica]|uniref:Uncharacterized protein n=1 Tax=Rickettsia asiatica TaxID=238800 RepID=A0A510G7C2_9RICK|nr:hypothetical protein [Rickettsia asiatica]BBJ31446.1 hypothetical protein RAS_05550 [Rickettsia asiatica]